jgi:CBS domain-containing protein
MTTKPIEFTATLSGLTIGDAMRPGVVSCRPEEDLASVAATMAGHGIHAIILEPLTSRNPRIVTDLELVRAMLKRPDGSCAGEIARDSAATLPSDASLDQAVAKLAELYVAHVLVTDPASGAPCGVISSFDLVAAISGPQPAAARMLRPGLARLAPSGRTLGEALAGHVIHQGVVTCAPDAPLWAVARSMAEHRVDCVAIAGVAEAGLHRRHFNWGLIDDMEIVLATHRRSLDEPATTIVAASPPAVNDSDTLEHAAELMVRDDARHVVVVGPSGLPSGIISTLDVVGILAAAAWPS